jgi:hypothetical protein
MYITIINTDNSSRLLEYPEGHPFMDVFKKEQEERRFKNNLCSFSYFNCVRDLVNTIELNPKHVSVTL